MIKRDKIELRIAYNDLSKILEIISVKPIMIDCSNKIRINITNTSSNEV